MDIFKKTINEIESKQNLEDFIANIQQYMDMCLIIAKGQKTYYEALIKEGFTEDQALKIVMAHGIFPGRVGENQGNGNE